MSDSSKSESENNTISPGCLLYGFGGVFILGGLAFLVGTGWFALQVEASRTWPQVPAQVVSSELGFRVDSDNDRFVDPNVTFRYDIDGKTYTGDRVSFGSGDAAWSQGRVNAYPVGRVIDVRVNPDDPTDAVIEPGGRGWERFLPLGGLVPLGVGVSIILSGRRRLRNPELMRGPSGPTKVGPKGHWIPATLGIIFTTVGVFIVRDGLTDIQIARASSTWPTTEGTVVLSEAHREWDSEDKRHTYFPVVVYTYDVEGVTYASDRIRPGSIKRSSRTSASALRLAKQYPEGSRQPVSYDPDQPSQATLVAGEGVSSWGTMVFGGIFTVIGLVIVLVFFPRPWAHQASNQGTGSPRS